MKIKEFSLQYPWDENGYKPEVLFRLGLDEIGYHLFIHVKERDPRRMETKHLNFVHCDSCVEWFVNFAPEICDRYFNFEVNANGIMYVAFRKDRQDFQLLKEADVAELNIQASVYPEYWEIRYTVPHEWIQRFIPDYSYRADRKIRANFYKCGDKMEIPHYGVWNEVRLAKPDFHRPEFFGEVSF